MRRLLPGLPIRMIGYTLSHQPSILSATLERLSDQYDASPRNSEVSSKLTAKILQLRNLQPHRRPKRSPAEECMDLDIDLMRSSSSSEEHTSSENQQPDSSLFSLALRAVLRRGRIGRGLQAIRLVLVGSFIRLVLGISKQRMANLVKHPPENAVARQEVEMALRKEVRINAEDDPGVLRTSKAKHPLQSIYSDISLMFLSACTDRLQVPSNVAD